MSLTVSSFESLVHSRPCSAPGRKHLSCYQNLLDHLCCCQRLCSLLCCGFFYSNRNICNFHVVFLVLVAVSFRFVQFVHFFLVVYLFPLFSQYPLITVRSVCKMPIIDKSRDWCIFSSIGFGICCWEGRVDDNALSHLFFIQWYVLKNDFNMRHSASFCFIQQINLQYNKH